MYQKVLVYAFLEYRMKQNAVKVYLSLLKIMPQKNRAVNRMTSIRFSPKSLIKKNIC